MIKIIGFLLYLFVFQAWAETPFAGLIIESPNESISLRDEASKQVVTFSKGVKLLVLSDKEARSLPDYDDERYYYKVANRDGYEGRVFSLNDGTFDKVAQKGKFGNWMASKYVAEYKPAFDAKYAQPSKTASSKPTTTKVDPKVSASVELEFNRDYKLKDGETPIKVIDPVTKKPKYVEPGQDFHVLKSRNSTYIVMPPDQTRYQPYNLSHISKAFAKGAVVPGELVSHKEPVIVKRAPSSGAKSSPSKPAKAKAADQQLNRKAEVPPTVEDSAWFAEKGLEFVDRIASTFKSEDEASYSPAESNDEKVNCDVEGNQVDAIGKPIAPGKLPYKKCNAEDDYFEPELVRLLTPTDYKETTLHACILAGLKSTPKNMRVARCENGYKVSSETPACASQNYVALIAKELKLMAECFHNIEVSELVPMANVESKFNINAYNMNRIWRNGKQENVLNASSLLQSTQVLINSQNEAYISNPDFIGLKDTPYCKAAIDGIINSPLSDERDVCERTSLPNGMRKNLYIATAQHSYHKRLSQEVLNNIQAEYFGDRLNIFDDKEKEKIRISLAKLMHNRGMGSVEKMMNMFFYDLFHGGMSEAQGKTRTNYNGRTVRHGNSRIYELWGRPGFKAPIGHEEFIKYFSSYIFYENKSRSQGKNVDVSSNKLDAEGGTYIHQMSCQEELLNKKASKLIKKDVICGHDPIPEERMEKTQVEVGWYLNVCDRDNQSQYSKRQCTSKDPYKAKNSDGRRRLSDAMIRKYRNTERYLNLCGREQIRGMASRPLKEFYSGESD